MTYIFNMKQKIKDLWVYFANEKNMENNVDENFKDLNLIKSDLINDPYSTKSIIELISNLPEKFKDYLSTLSLNEICLVINITSSLLILGCFISILLSIYGNFLIDKLSLEKKYPKMAGFIKLKTKLQHGSIIINSLVIFVTNFAMIVTNFIVLIN